MKKTLRLNVSLNGKVAGNTVEIDCDEFGTPVEKYWRARLKDSKFDNCVEEVNSKIKKNKSEDKEKGDKT